MCVRACVCGVMMQMTPFLQQIRAPLTDCQKIVNERDSELAQYFAPFWGLGLRLGYLATISRGLAQLTLGGKTFLPENVCMKN